MLQPSYIWPSSSWGLVYTYMFSCKKSNLCGVLSYGWHKAPERTWKKLFMENTFQNGLFWKWPGLELSLYKHEKHEKLLLAGYDHVKAMWQVYSLKFSYNSQTEHDMGRNCTFKLQKGGNCTCSMHVPTWQSLKFYNARNEQDTETRLTLINSYCQGAKVYCSSWLEPCKTNF